jgi:hypothetical protein
VRISIDFYGKARRFLPAPHRRTPLADLSRTVNAVCDVPTLNSYFYTLLTLDAIVILSQFS